LGPARRDRLCLDAPVPPASSKDRDLPLLGARAHVAEIWDKVVDGFLAGDSDLPSDLEEWAEAYHGQGNGEVEWDALPEPYLGPLDRQPRAVFLALNPGASSQEMQSRTGLLVDEIKRMGSYRAWAASWPYLRDIWVKNMGRNRHHTSRLTFMRRWWDQPGLKADDMLSFELYPWHSPRLTAPVRPDPELIQRYVFAPLEELDAPPIFAFGADWFSMLEHHLRLPVRARLGVGGDPYPTQAAGRSVVVFSLPSGATVIAVKHRGSAGPPSASETLLLQEALTSVGLEIPSVSCLPKIRPQRPRKR
jgi:hypothetical protein